LRLAATRRRARIELRVTVLPPDGCAPAWLVHFAATEASSSNACVVAAAFW